MLVQQPDTLLMETTVLNDQKPEMAARLVLRQQLGEHLYFNDLYASQNLDTHQRVKQSQEEVLMFATKNNALQIKASTGMAHHA